MLWQKGLLSLAHKYSSSEEQRDDFTSVFGIGKTNTGILHTGLVNQYYKNDDENIEKAQGTATKRLCQLEKMPLRRVQESSIFLIYQKSELKGT